jgi:DNA-binding winged helix-turn-helix (wHTH) protein/TolB-like protein/tetratricopeptide (TPR) repeat protein
MLGRIAVIRILEKPWEVFVSDENGNNKHKAYEPYTMLVFDGFEIDPLNRTCIREGVALPISGKVFDVLLAFIESPGRLLTKDELIERVWSDEFVEEGNLARNVSSLRKALGDTEKDHRYIVTVPGHGYRFVADVRSVNGDPAKSDQSEVVSSSESAGPDSDSAVREAKWRNVFWALAALVIVFTVAWFSKDRFFTPSPTIKSLAVLPLRGIDPNDNYLGIGIADAVIRRVGSTGQVTVRPTTAVLHYLNQEPDTLAAARELNTDAVLEGNVQRSGDRLRVSVNLLRTADGTSLWNESFEMKGDDIFRVQDEVAVRVADKLKIRLGSNILASSNDKYPVDQRAYEFYLKGMFGLDARGFDQGSQQHMLNTIDLFQQAIVIDPNYAMAHGQLAFSYAWMAVFVQPEEPKWVDLAHQEIATAEKLDPNVAEAHVASGLLYWSAYGGYKPEEALKEFRLAKQLNPGWNGADMIAVYGHVGLDEQATKELNRNLISDPTSQALNTLVSILTYLRGDADAWYALNPKGNVADRNLAPWYFMRKGNLDQAQKVLDKELANDPEYTPFLLQRSLLIALKGDTAQAEAQIPAAIAKISRNREYYHHQTYFAACIEAVAGNSAEAVKWLRETANSGFPDYPLFAKDPFLDKIRQSPEFIQFMVEQKAQWEHFEQEFPVE